MAHNTYYESELARLDVNTQITVQFRDGNGRETRNLNLNDESRAVITRYLKDRQPTFEVFMHPTKGTKHLRVRVFRRSFSTATCGWLPTIHDRLAPDKYQRLGVVEMDELIEHIDHHGTEKQKTLMKILVARES